MRPESPSPQSQISQSGTGFHGSLLSGPFLVSIGAFLWSTDSLFRSQLTPLFSPLMIVTITHVLCLFIALPLVISYRHHWKRFSKSNWLALLFLSLGGSILAMICFTKAFALTKNYNIPILLQKLQPVIAITLAAVILKEKLTKAFFVLAALAMFGAYLISMGDVGAISNLRDAELEVILYTLVAAIIWGGCTVASRSLMTEHPFALVTASRYLVATAGLLFTCFFIEDFTQLEKFELGHLQNFFLMAYLPGFLALFLYYQGLEETKASVATLCELAFPLGAVLINWVFLSSSLNGQQIAGALILILSVTAINIQVYRVPKSMS